MSEHDEQHDRNCNAPHELMRAFRQLRNISWNNRRPIENCTPAETMTLFFIRKATNEQPEGLKASEISNIMNVASPTMTQTLNVLMARGLIDRETDPNDRRAVRIKLTEEGQRLTQLAESKMHEKLTALIAHLGEERAMLLVELIDDAAAFFHASNPDFDPGCFKLGQDHNQSTNSKEGD
ncbi:MarR family winged helix-turn-helix transcriptional regulator [Paenibacillus sp. OV219]|uniref:MarR family winged helix-turn-helix transcriptional regulator n=1 Tax=Paenibacillus sp. OV219 TaxID=1884377 RepID=UPI0008D3935F|nr:MarR family transcriptional regulator [Paenibacillus sp. OV219]SEN58013.1 DNA-binding transcriptional regulator, MarR family [Paenibacillus sp. OV219]